MEQGGEGREGALMTALRALKDWKKPRLYPMTQKSNYTVGTLLHKGAEIQLGGCQVLPAPQGGAAKACGVSRW